MKTVKPREIFNLLEDDGWSVTVPMPRGPFGLEVGQGLTLLETFLLIAIARIVNAEYIFEFGTHHGATARALVRNTDAAVTTMDRESCPIPLPPTIRQIVCDSRDWKPDKTDHAKYNLVFVDGGHDPETFANDCYLAHRILAPGGIIVWHDCGNPEFPHIEEFLEDRAIRIESTMLAVEGLKIP